MTGLHSAYWQLPNHRLILNFPKKEVMENETVSMNWSKLWCYCSLFADCINGTNLILPQPSCEVAAGHIYCFHDAARMREQRLMVKYSRPQGFGFCCFIFYHFALRTLFVRKKWITLNGTPNTTHYTQACILNFHKIINGQYNWHSSRNPANLLIKDLRINPCIAQWIVPFTFAESFRPQVRTFCDLQIR